MDNTDNTMEEFAASTADSFNEWWNDTFSFPPINMLIFVGIVAVITFVVIKLIKRFLRKRLTGNMRIFYRLIYIIIVVIAVSAVLMTIKPLQEFSTAILASSGIAAAVFGLAAQQTLGNLFSGISISASKPFEAGEYIEILNTNPPISGIVQSIAIRHTTIRDSSNRTIVIPNGVIDKEMLRTTHYLEGRDVCNFLVVGVGYGSDIGKAIDLLRKIISAHPDVLDMRTPEQKENGGQAVDVYITDLGDSAVQLRASVWTKDTATGFATLSDIRFSVLEEFAKHSIEIPYPYRNVVVQEAEQTEPAGSEKEKTS